MTLANPYFINIILKWPNGNLANKNEIARVRAYDVYNGTQTWESECGYDDATGGWKPAVMQDVAIFTDREHPNLVFEVWSVAEKLLYTTDLHTAIVSGETVTIIIGQSSSTGNDIWIVSGHLNRYDSTPIINATVQAFDVTGGNVVSLGSSVTIAPYGAYSITYKSADFANNGGPHSSPNLLLLARDERLQELVRRDDWSSISRNYVAELTTPEEPALAVYSVFGQVFNALGLPVQGVYVEAYHLTWTADGPKEILLGSQVQSGCEGKFKISYYPPVETTITGPCKVPIGQINLLVYAKETATSSTTLDSKGVIFDAAKEQQVDLFVNLVATSTGSEYQQIKDRLSDCLGTTSDSLWNALNLFASRPEYLAFLSKTTGIEEAKLQSFARAWTVAGEIDGYCVKIEPTTGHSGQSEMTLKWLRLPIYGNDEPHSPEIMYAIVRAGLGDTLTRIIDVPSETLFRAWLEASHNKQVSSSIESNIGEILEDWKKLLGRVLGSPTNDPNRWQARLINLAICGNGSAEQDKRAKVVAAVYENTLPFADLCFALVKKGEITQAEAETLVFAFELFDAVGRYFDIVAKIVQVRGVSEPLWIKVSDLATVTQDEWYGYIKSDTSLIVPDDVPGNTSEERARVYAARLYSIFSGSSPETKFLSDLTTNAEPGTTDVEAAKFITDNPKFDLQTSNIDLFVADWPDARKPSADTINTLKELQRLYRLTSDYKATSALRTLKFTSAIQIAQVDEDEFVIQTEKVLGGVTVARTIHRAACFYANEVLFTVIKYNQNVNAVGGAPALTSAVSLASIASKSPLEGYDATIGKVVENSAKNHRMPNWVTLFGDINKCACKHCQTVLSPGAYLVDLLQFIDKSFKETSNRALKYRRGDIEEIEITCPNTDRMLPYIDLVNEVLENVVAMNEGGKTSFPLSTTLDDATVVPVTRTQLNNAVNGNATDYLFVINAFAEHGYTLTEKALVKYGVAEIRAPEDRDFIVEDESWHFRIPAVSSGATYQVLPFAQTSATNDSLEVFPEHYNPQAYNALSKAVFPFNLPLFVGKEETAIFLKQRNVYRHEILEAFTTSSLDDKLNELMCAEAYLGLTSEEAAVILQQRADLVLRNYWGFGTANQAPNLFIIPRPDKSTIKIKDTWQRLLAIVPVFLHRAAISYQQLLDLLATEFIHVEITTGDKVRIVSSKNDLVECNYNNFQLANLDDAVLSRISCFLRLWRKLGWSMRELDRYLMEMESGQIPQDLKRLALTKRLADELSLPILSVIAFYRPIDTYRSDRNLRSTFDDVFLKGASRQPEYRALERLALYGEGIDIDFEPSDSTQKEDYQSHIRAALKLKSKDFDELWIRFTDTRTLLNVEQLTNLYRTATLLTKLKCSIFELDELLVLVGSQMLPVGTLPTMALDAALIQSLATLREIRRVKELQFNVSEGNYYLNARETIGATYLPTEEENTALLARLSSAAASIVTAIPSASNVDQEALRGALAKIMPEEKISRIIQIIEGPETAPDSEPPLNDPSFVSPRNMLWNYLACLLPPRPTIQQGKTEFPESLLHYNSSFSKSARYSSVWQRLVKYLTEKATTEAALDVATEISGLNRDTTDHLLSSTLSSVISTGKAIDDWKQFVKGGVTAHDVLSGGILSGSRSVKIIFPADGNYRIAVTLPTISTVSVTNVIFDGGSLATESTRIDDVRKVTDVTFAPCSVKAQSVHSLSFDYSANVSTTTEPLEVTLAWRTEGTDPTPIASFAFVQFDEKAYLKLRKAAGLLKQMRLNAAETEYLLTRVTATTDLNLDKLPLSLSDTPVTWQSVTTFTELAKLNRTVALQSQTLFELMTSSKTLSNDDLAKELDCKVSEIEAVQRLWSVSTLPTVKSPEFWYVLNACRSIAFRLDLRIDQVKDLLMDPNPSTGVANTVRNVYRARFTKDTWKDAFKPHRDKLRQKQRDALVGYLTSQPIGVGKSLSFFNANDLYAYYLIDVEMEPDTLISRLKLALNSIQLYVERIFLGLEPDTAKIDLGKARELWAWMRSYRVWEANRKVFLYPENWIMPELRDDKSEFFREFEQELLGGEISTELGNAALGNFLEKITEVSNLEIVGLYCQSVQAGAYNYILHVVGRTRYQPRAFYYRTFQGKQAYDGDWTAWRKIDLEINADVVAPAVFNGRLHLFWLSVQTKQKTKPFPNNNDNDTQSNGKTIVTGEHAYQDRGDYQSEIRLMWSEYLAAEKKWLKPRLSKDRLMDYEVIKIPEREIGKDVAETSCYHLRLDEASGEFISIGLVKTKEPDSSGKISPRQLGAFALRFNGHDSFNGDQQELQLGNTWPVGTVLRHNAAEEVPQAVEGEVGGDRLKFLGAVPFLQRTSETFRVYQTNFNYVQNAGYKPFFFETPTKSLFGINRGQVVQGTMSREAVQKICLQTFNNPQIRDVQSRFQSGGTTGIMNRLVQALPVSENYYYNYYNFRSNYYYNYYGNLYLGYHIAGDSMAWGTTQRKFEIEYLPRTDSVDKPFPLPTIEFGYGTPFGLYNWELFFHAPLLVADRLMHELKFEEAMNWYHYIFDPKQELNFYERTKRWVRYLPVGCRYWNFLPFFANKCADDSLLDVLGLRKNLSAYERADLTALIDEWRRNPFNPHLIARQRIVAYQKRVVMGYLDNLIAWGDQLFRQDTFESINRATQLYVLAAELLGQKPEQVESLVREPRYTYSELKARKFDSFSEAMEDVEYMVVGNREQVKLSSIAPQTASVSHVKNLGMQTAYFQIPRNEKLDSYWDTVADRLFKIRNSMNIDGIKRQLALFEPPIDPALLVRAAAAGLNLSSVLGQLNAPMPLYRFNTWMQKAVELCNEVKSFGSALLSALEKKDAEALQLLRQSHEIKMLELARNVRLKQIEEAEQNIVALERSRAIAEERYNHYQNLEKVSGTENSQISHTKTAGDYELAQGVIHSVASLFTPVPDGKAGIVGPFPLVAADLKVGTALLAAANCAAAVAGTVAGYHRSEANLAGINAGHERRWEDWQFQLKLAEKEMEQLDQQIIAASIRKAIAELELSNHEQQMEHAEEVQTFLSDKFTNEELYVEMIRQLSRNYQNVYKLAYDVAKKAERTFQFELGTDEAGFVQFDYMSNLKMGLLAGEYLINDLKRMEIAYLERNKRELEIQKSISLATIDGKALQALRDEGQCTFELSEMLFDLDFPGHYFRRIKAVRVSIPCVTGPHTSVSAKLTLLQGAIRKQSTSGTTAEEYQYQGFDDPRFVHDLAGTHMIATSSAQNDAGLFELNFRDERYLPFEGSGVISRWTLELPTAARQFDYDTISDVVLHISYTAREAGGTLRLGAEENIRENIYNLAKMALDDAPKGLVRVFSLRKEFPDVFHQLLAGSGASVAMTILPEHFPYLLQSTRAKTSFEGVQEKVDFIVHPKPAQEIPLSTFSAKLNPSAESPESNSISGTATVLRTVTRGSEPLFGNTWNGSEVWTLGLSANNSTDIPKLSNIDDILFVLQYGARIE